MWICRRAVAVLVAPSSAPANGRLTSDAHFTLRANQGPSVNVTLAAAATSTNVGIDDLVDDLNAALAIAGLGGEVVAGRDADRLKFTVTASAGTDEALVQLNAAALDAAVTQLGFVNGQFVADSVEQHVFIEDAVVTASANLTAADLDIAAALGFLDVGIVDGSGTAVASVSVALTDPTTGTPGGRVTLDELFAGLDSDLASITARRRSPARPISCCRCRVDPNILGGEHPTNPAVTVDWTDITNPATLTVTPNADMQRLLDFRDLSFVDIVDALQAAIDYLATLKQFSFLNQELPLVNASVTELIDYADEFAERLEELRANPAASLQFVEQTIEDTFDLPPEAVTLSLENGALRIGLSFATLASATRSIDLDLAALSAAAGGVPQLDGIANLIDVAGSAQLSLDAGATLAYRFGH